jgi:hypothetical protein
MNIPSNFEKLAIHEQHRWIDEKIAIAEKRLKELRQCKIDIATKQARGHEIKAIKNSYTLLRTVRKNRLIHEIGRGQIYPLDYYSGRWGESIQGSTAHSIDNGSSFRSFSDPKSIQLMPIRKIFRKDRPHEFVITITHGIVCEKCDEFCCGNDDYVNNMTRQFWDISNRKELAAFLKNARKKSISVTKGLCSHCKWVEDKESKKVHLAELERHSQKTRQPKQIKIIKTSEENDAYQFLAMANAAAELANYTPTTK